MILQRLILATAAVALAASLSQPATADQTFQSVSTGKLPAPTATYNPNNITIDYVYYPCGTTNGGNNGRFNPFGASDNNGPLTGRYRGGSTGCGSGHRYHRQPNPPPPGRVIPFATPRS